MIILLDDLTSHLYGKLKADSDRLEQLRIKIKCNNKLISMLMDIWLEYNQLGMKEADAIFNQKWDLEVEMSRLLKEEQVLIKKVASHVS